MTAVLAEKVIDLAAYRAAHRDGDPPTGRPERRPTPVLTARGVAHRERMLRHLAELAGRQRASV